MKEGKFVQAILWDLILDTDQRSRLNFFSYDSGPPGWLALIFRDPEDPRCVAWSCEPSRITIERGNCCVDDPVQVDKQNQQKNPRDWCQEKKNRRE